MLESVLVPCEGSWDVSYDGSDAESCTVSCNGFCKVPGTDWIKDV